MAISIARQDVISSRQQALAEALTALRRGDTGAVRCALARFAPEDPDAALVDGLASALDRNFEAAAARLCPLAAARPAHAHPATDLASLTGPGDDRPTWLLRACLDRTPGEPRLTAALADRLTEAGRPHEALAVLDRALAADPDESVLLNLRGIALGEAGHHDEAEAAFRASLARAPDRAPAWSNLGMTLKTLGRHEAALAAHDRAISLAPRDAQLQVNRAVALLRAGRLEEGFAAYEWRLAQPGHTTLPPARLLPRLGALDRLDGMTILVTHEEGFGDTLQCARYLPMLAALGARVIAWVPDELARLVARIEGVAAVLPTRATAPVHDWHCPFLSLPRALSTSLSTIPWRGPYLTADPARADALAALLPASGRRIGIAWAGQARHRQPGFGNLDRRRSADPAILAPLGSRPGISLVSLQYGAPAPPGIDGRAIAEATDFADTAAIVSRLDAVVSVDTAIAHLAGGLGVPVFLLDRFDGCWRWLHARRDTPWYPSMTILRQPAPGDWASVIADLAARL